MNEIALGDLLYDIELTGNIYRAYVILDNMYVMKVHNQFSNNYHLKIPEFTLNKPYPLNITAYTKFMLGIEMNNSFEEGKNEKIHLGFKIGNLNINNKTRLMKEFKFNIYMNECTNIDFDIYGNYLMIFSGKCIPIILKPLEYYI